MGITAGRSKRGGDWAGLLVVASLVAVSPGGACSAADPAEIKTAIERGVRYLADTQSRNGTWNSSGHELGETALAGMAIVAGGGDAYRAKVEAAAAAVRRLAVAETNTYDISLAIMFLDRLGRTEDDPLLRDLGVRLMAGQCQDGSWSYHVPAMARGAASEPLGRGTGDNSNTQFAALAAWISRRHGLPNDAALQRLDQHFRNTFDSNLGGWGYVGQSSATATMTCAGLVGLATNLGAERQRNDDNPPQGGPKAQQQRGAAVTDHLAKTALAALGNELAIANRDPTSKINQDLYFFWSLERVGVIYGVRDMNGIDWYRWGSDRLVRGQLGNGEWSGVSGSKGWRYEANVGTSFAILFLCKANVAADLTAQVGTGGGSGRGGGVPEEAAPAGLGGGPQYMRRARRDDPPPGTQSGTQPGDPGKATPDGRNPAKKPAKQPDGKQPDGKPQPGPGVLEPF